MIVDFYYRQAAGAGRRARAARAGGV